MSDDKLNCKEVALLLLLFLMMILSFIGLVASFATLILLKGAGCCILICITAFGGIFATLLILSIYFLFALFSKRKKMSSESELKIQKDLLDDLKKKDDN